MAVSAVGGGGVERFFFQVDGMYVFWDLRK